MAVPAADTARGTPEEEVVDLLAEEVLVEESGVQELTSDDLAPAVEKSVSSPEDGEEELIELDVSLIHEEGTPVSSSPEEPAAPGREAEEVLEEMESPSGRIVEGLNRISEALIHGDVQAIRAGSRELSATADRYGMHTLADMARCFRAAWEEGDVEAAAQIVEEMRAEAARLQRP